MDWIFFFFIPLKCYLNGSVIVWNVDPCYWYEKESLNFTPITHFTTIHTHKHPYEQFRLIN